DPAESGQRLAVDHEALSRREAEALVDTQGAGRVLGIDAEGRERLAVRGGRRDRLRHQRRGESATSPRFPGADLADVVAADAVVVREDVRRDLVAVQRDAGVFGSE